MKTSTARPASLLLRCLLGALGLGAWAASQAATPLSVSLTTDQPVVQGDGRIEVMVHVSNPGDTPARVLRWELPQSTVQGPLFKVTRSDGSAAPYLGALVKRAEPRASDYVQIAPGATLSYPVDLAARYAFGDGQYQVEYVGLKQSTGLAKAAATQPLQLWTSGRSAVAAKLATATPGATEALVAGPTISYTSCSANRRSLLATAVTDATTYASNAATYLSTLTRGKPRYVTWFGTYRDNRRKVVLAHYTKEVTAFTTKPLRMDCSCSDAGVYAYVYPSDPYRIYLCGAFWAAPARGTDSKAGTLVHEMSHFTVVAGTDDYAYGQTAAKALALSNPLQAIMNADSHEYFAENRPVQP